MGLALLVVAVLTRQRPIDAGISALAGFVAVGLGILPYVLRAWGSVALTLGLVVVGLGGGGPAHGLHERPVTFGLQLVAVSVLASALLVRATYRSSRRARFGVAVGIALFVVAATFVSGVATWSASAPTLARLVATAMVLVAALSLLAFMGEETTGGTGTTAVAAVSIAGLLSFLHASLSRVPFAAQATSVLSGLAVATLAVTATYLVTALSIGPREHEAQRARMRTGAGVRADVETRDLRDE